jgi:hypothetical protein
MAKRKIIKGAKKRWNRMQSRWVSPRRKRRIKRVGRRVRMRVTSKKNLTVILIVLGAAALWWRSRQATPVGEIAGGPSNYLGE